MARRLKVVKYELVHVNYAWLGAYRLRVEIQDSIGMQPYVFLYRRGLPDLSNGEAIDHFMAVCSPADMEEWPALEPDPDKSYPFFRLDYIELDFRNVDKAKRTYDLILLELSHLVQALDRLDLLVPTEETWIGDEPAAGDSDSESVSTSESVSSSVSTSQ